MEWLTSLLLVLDIICALGVIILVLLQHGKGADMGAAFGSGASGSLFGATGGANFLSRLTAGFATGFFVLTLALALIGNKKPGAPKSIMENAPASKVGDGIPGQSGAPAKVEAPKSDAPKADAPKADAPKSDAPKTDLPKADAPKADAPKASGGDIPK